MLGYIISKKHEINVENYKIKSFDILHKMLYYVFLIYYKLKYGKFDENAIYKALYYGDVKFLEWFKNYCNIKKIIKISNSNYNKTIKFKNKNNYIKGYNKN
jgi:hypothetical protein